MTSYWKEEADIHGTRIKSISNVSPGIIYDFVIIGGGWMGVALAWFLSRIEPKSKDGNSSKYRILIIERADCIASEASGNNGGHFWPSILDSPSALLCGRLTRYGSVDKEALEQLRHIYQLGDHSYEDLYELLERYNLVNDVQLVNGGGLYIVKEQDAMVQLEKDILLMKESIYNNSTKQECPILYKEKSELIEKFDFSSNSSVDLKGGSLEGRACQISPVLLVRSILELAQRDGHVDVLLNTSVTSLHEGISDTQECFVHVKTDKGHAITCRSVCHCTNDMKSDDGTSLLPIWIKKNLKQNTGHLISIMHSSFPCNTKLPYGVTTSDMFYSLYRPKDHTYIIGHMANLSPGKKTGAEDHSYWIEYLTEILGIKNAHILSEITWNDGWTGRTGTSQDNLPITGKILNTQRQWVSIATSGLGIIHIWGIARGLCQDMHHYAQLGCSHKASIPSCFSPDRFYSP